MLTRNWYRLVSHSICTPGLNSTDTIVCKNIKGTTTGVSSNNYLNFLVYNVTKLKTALATGSGASGVFFGAGDTAPTVDDYTLSGDVISGISITSSISVVGKEVDAEYAEFTAVYSISNTNAEEITVREVASVYYGCLLDRTVLDTPVTIPAGGIGQVTYTIRMNYPTA